MNITVAGCGRWGSCVADYLFSLGNDVTLYGRPSSVHMKQLKYDRKNEFLEIPAEIKLSTKDKCFKNAEIIVVAIDLLNITRFFEMISELELKSKVFVLCTKGIEMSTGRRMSEVARDSLDKSNRIAVWLGPGHPKELTDRIPNCMVIDSDDKDTKRLLINSFSSSSLRLYYGDDLIGNEIGAAAKNVVGIAAGFLDGVGYSSLKSALITRAPGEFARLISAMGGKSESVYGLCHLGDYQATVFSESSRNRMFGESFAKGDTYYQLAEGCYTCKALKTLGEKYNVDMPINDSVYSILYKEKNVQETIEFLFSRKQRSEF